MAARVELIRDLDRPNAWLLAVEGVPQSYVDLDDPRHLEFEYVRLIADVVDTVTAAGERLDVVHLGGGGCTLPRYVAATRPGSNQLVFEVDEEVVAVVRDRLGMAAVSGVAVRLADARMGLLQCADESADVVVADVFDGPAVPAHLLTLDALTDVRRVLRPGGLLVANIADSAPFDFARRVLATLRVVFDDVVLLGEPSILRGRRFGNLVPVASMRPLPLTALSRAAARSVPPVRLVEGDALAAYVGDAVAATDVDPAVAPAPPDWTLGGVRGRGNTGD